MPDPPPEECGGPDEGIRPVLTELADHFPTDKFLNLFLEAISYDEEFLMVMYYLQGSSFGRIVYEIQNMEPWKTVGKRKHLSI